MWPLASIVHGAGSSSVRSIGVMRIVLPSFTYTYSGPPVVPLVNRLTPLPTSVP